MKSLPDVSVVIGVFNGASRIVATLDSILNQRGIDLEVIVVDDGSTDSTPAIIREYSGRDPRINLIRQERRGLTQGLIAGCECARAGYIARQDVGDVSFPRRLAIQKDALDKCEELAFVSCWVECVGPDEEFLYLLKGTGLANNPTSIICESHPDGIVAGPSHHGSVMFRKHFYHKAGGYRRQFYFGQDWDLWYRMGEIGKFQMIPEVLGRVAILPDSISSINKMVQRSIGQLSVAALRCRLKGASDQEVLNQAEKLRPTGVNGTSFAVADAYYFIGEMLRKNRDNRSRRYFKRSIRANPFSVKSWVRLIQESLSSIT